MNEAITKPAKLEWKRWKMGWGETLTINKYLHITAAHSDIRGEGFYWQFLDARSNPNYQTIEECKIAAIAFANRVLTDGLEKLLRQ